MRKLYLYLLLLCTSVLHGCASTGFDKYQTLTLAADDYMSSYVEVLDLTANVSIENSSLEVIEYHFNTPEAERKSLFYADAAAKFEDSYSQTKSRLVELGLLRSHLRLFRAYFRKLAEFAGDKVASESESALKSSAGEINQLVSTISGNANKVVIKDADLQDLTTLSNYIFRLKKEKTLKEVIRADIDFLNENLILHERGARKFKFNYS